MTYWFLAQIWSTDFGANASNSTQAVNGPIFVPDEGKIVVFAMKLTKRQFENLTRTVSEQAAKEQGA